MLKAESTMEHVTCPICLELPRKEVFQCHNGHPICHRCCASLAECPQCRVPYEAVKIRNRVAEGLLDTMEIHCPFQNQGCSLTMRRQDLGNHSQICNFRPINLCSLLVEISCKFSSSQPSQIYQHIVNRHGMDIRSGLQIEVKMDDIFRSRLNNHSLHCDYVIPWQIPYGRKLDLFLLCLLTSRESEATGDRSFFCLHMGNNPQISSRFVVSLQVDIPVASLTWSWTGRPTHYLEAESMLKHPALKIPLGYAKSALKASGHGGAVYGFINASVNWV